MELTFDFIRFAGIILAKKQIIDVYLGDKSTPYRNDFGEKCYYRQQTILLKTDTMIYEESFGAKNQDGIIDRYNEIKYLVNEWRYLNGRKDFIE